jgi:hypothetical protein
MDDLLDLGGSSSKSAVNRKGGNSLFNPDDVMVSLK